MAGEDPLDFRTKGSGVKAQAGPYTKYLKTDALQGKRFGVPAFIVEVTRRPARSPFSRKLGKFSMKAVEELRAAGPRGIGRFDFAGQLLERVQKIKTWPYHSGGVSTPFSSTSALRNINPRLNMRRHRISLCP